MRLNVFSDQEVEWVFRFFISNFSKAEIYFVV